MLDAHGLNTLQAPPGPPIWQRDAIAGEAPSVFLFTAHPMLDGLESALNASGIAALRVSSISQARSLLATRRTQAIAIVDTYQPAPYAFDAVYNLLHDHPQVPTLVLCHEGGSQATPPAWETGHLSDDYATLPASVNELTLRVKALLLRAGLPLPRGLAAAETAGPNPNRQGQVVALFGLKGGIGRSTIAANLAVSLVQSFGREVVLADADLWYSAQSHLLDLQSDKSMLAAAREGLHVDHEMLESLLVPHGSGVQVLLGAQHPTHVERIPADLPARLINGYRSLNDFVIVDTHPSMDEYVLAILDVADHILLVTTPEIGPLHSTAQVLILASALGWRDRVRLVVNRANHGVDLRQIEDTLGLPVYASIVSDGAVVTTAANRGQPIVMMDRTGKEPITRDLVRLAARTAGEPEPSWERPARAWTRALDWLSLPRPVWA